MLYFTVFLNLNTLLTRCSPDGKYRPFSGFNINDWVIYPRSTTASLPHTRRPDHDPQTRPYNPTYAGSPSSPSSGLVTGKETIGYKATEITTTTEKHKNKTKNSNWTTTEKGWVWFESHDKTTLLPKVGVASNCPEAEKPSNIGPYEVPTERDLVLITLKTLHSMFASYHQKAMLFLDDIGKVVWATEQVANKCIGKRKEYKKCVKHFSKKAEVITKSLTSSLEQERQDILAFGRNEDTICSIQSMKEDPVKLIKILASEEASLDFALPGFLRLLNSCNSVCSSPTSGYLNITKPSRHLTDTDVVIRHFLTRKNYTRLLKPKESVFNIPVPNRKILIKP